MKILVLYLCHLVANLKVAIKCGILLIFHVVHGIVPCKYTSHDYWKL